MGMMRGTFVSKPNKPNPMKQSGRSDKQMNDILSVARNASIQEFGGSKNNADERKLPTTKGKLPMNTPRPTSRALDPAPNKKRPKSDDINTKGKLPMNTPRPTSRALDPAPNKKRPKPDDI